MSNTIKRFTFSILLGSPIIVPNLVTAQENLYRDVKDHHLRHGIEQYEAGHYVQAIHSLSSYLEHQALPMTPQLKPHEPNINRDLAEYYQSLAKIKYGADDLEDIATSYINTTVNPVHRDRVAYQLAHHYFKTQQYEAALNYYEKVDIKNLSNDEIADAKFEQAYSYFVQSDFDNAFPLFQSIKEIDGKYYDAGNYYYGLIAYNRKQYDNALRSFDRIKDNPEYQDIVPYYIAEIHYFKGDYNKVLELSNKHLNSSTPLHYHKEMHLLTGQVYFEQKAYQQALPHLEYYYNNSEKIQKEHLYELGYTYYHLKNYEKAIPIFKPLSNTNDSLGQNSMYLLGDAYLQLEDKQGAMNAFSIASSMDHMPAIKEESSFLYGKLSYELGKEQLSIQALNDFIHTYPNSTHNQEAKSLLVSLLSKSKNYAAAYNIISEIPVNTPFLQSLYQRITLGNAMQYMKANDWTTALTYLNESLKYNHDKAVYGVSQFWKSFALYNTKNYSEAANAANSFISLAKTNGDAIKKISPEATLNNAYTHLGYVEMELKNYTGAQQAFQTAGNQTASSATDQKINHQNLLLQADAAFMNKKFDEAAVLYEKALAANTDNPAYATYQKALIAGIKNNDAEKISLLQKVISTYPNHSITPTAQYELAITQLEKGENPTAIASLEKLAQGNNKDLSAKALQQLAFHAKKAGDIQASNDYYATFLKQYPTHPDKENVLQALRGNYIQQGDAQGYYNFLSANNINDPSAQSEEATYFEIAENKFIDEDYAAAAENFDKYLQRYPNGAQKIAAQYYKAESFYELQQYEKAITAYQAVIQSGKSEYAQLTYLNLAKSYLATKQYNEAREYANQYIQIGKDDISLADAHLIALKSAIAQGDSESAAASIEYLNQQHRLLSPEEIQLLKIADAQQRMDAGDYAAATSIYTEIAAQKSGAASAEARYKLAEILLLQNKLQEAESAADRAIEANEGETYWLIKSYILIGKILAEQKDYFNARATLQSVISNSSIPALSAEAQAALDIINEAEKSDSKMLQE